MPQPFKLMIAINKIKILNSYIGSGTITQPDGTTVEMSQTADPRFGWQIPYTNKIKTTLPSGKSVTIETQKTAELLENDIFKPSKLKNQTTINGSRTVTKEIDVVNKTIKTKSPMGKEGISYFNEKGQIVQSEIPGMLPVNYEYDTKGRVTKVSQDERYTLMRYDFNTGYLSEVENVDGDIVKYFYDEVGQLVRTILPNSEEINQSYDANGNVTDIILPQTEENISRNHTYEYTAIDQVDYYETPVTYGISYRTDYDYNLDGQLTTVTEPTNNVINYNYDATTGVLQSIDYPHDTLTYSYNAESKNLERIQTANGDSLVYDYDGSLLKTEANTGTLGDYIEWKYNEFLMVNEIIAKGQSTLYGYNNDGELTRAGLSVYERNTLNGRIEKITIGETDEYYTYNNYGEIEKKEVKYQNNLIYSESYVYNNKGFITVKTVINGNTTDIYNYTYDNLGRLTEVIKNGLSVESYSFDSNGNRLNNDAEYDNQDRLLAYGSNTYTYTQRGSLREKTTANGTTLYNYDVIGNLRGVTLEDGTVIDYVIDGRNRRIAKKVNGVTVQKFLYLNQLEPIAELDGNNNLVSLFVYGSKGNVPEYIIKNGVAYKIITNQLGSVVKVINAYGGIVQQEIEYDSFGNILSDSNPTFQPFRLAGGLYDVDTKLIRFGARDYDSETGRWTSKDPIKFDGGRNFYVYANGNLITRIDTNGLYDYNPMNPYKSVDMNAIYEIGKFFDEVIKVIKCADYKKLGWGFFKVGLSIYAAIGEGFIGNIDKIDLPLAWDGYIDGLADIFQAFDRNSEIANKLRSIEVGSMLKYAGTTYINKTAGDLIYNHYLAYSFAKTLYDLPDGRGWDTIASTIANGKYFWDVLNEK